MLVIYSFVSDTRLKPRIVLLNALPWSYSPSPGKEGDKNKASEKTWVREGR